MAEVLVPRDALAHQETLGYLFQKIQELSWTLGRAC